MRRTADKIQDVIKAIDAGDSWPIPCNGYVSIFKEDGLYTAEFIDPTRPAAPNNETSGLSPYKTIVFNRKQLEDFLGEKTRL